MTNHERAPVVNRGEYFDEEIDAARQIIVGELILAEDQGVVPDIEEINRKLECIDDTQGAISIAWDLALNDISKTMTNGIQEVA